MCANTNRMNTACSARHAPSTLGATNEIRNVGFAVTKIHNRTLCFAKHVLLRRRLGIEVNAFVKNERRLNFNNSMLETSPCQEQVYRKINLKEGVNKFKMLEPWVPWGRGSLESILSHLFSSSLEFVFNLHFVLQDLAIVSHFEA